MTSLILGLQPLVYQLLQNQQPRQPKSSRDWNNTRPHTRHTQRHKHDKTSQLRRRVAIILKGIWLWPRLRPRLRNIPRHRSRNMLRQHVHVSKMLHSQHNQITCELHTHSTVYMPAQYGFTHHLASGQGTPSSPRHSASCRARLRTCSRSFAFNMTFLVPP